MDNPTENMEEIQSYLDDINSILLEGSDQPWTIQYTWIQALCDIIIHKPLITM